MEREREKGRGRKRRMENEREVTPCDSCGSEGGGRKPTDTKNECFRLVLQRCPEAQ